MNGKIYPSFNIVKNGILKFIDNELDSTYKRKIEKIEDIELSAIIAKSLDQAKEKFKETWEGTILDLEG